MVYCFDGRRCYNLSVRTAMSANIFTSAFFNLAARGLLHFEDTNPERKRNELDAVGLKELVLELHPMQPQGV